MSEKIQQAKKLSLKLGLDPITVEEKGAFGVRFVVVKARHEGEMVFLKVLASDEKVDANCIVREVRVLKEAQGTSLGVYLPGLLAFQLNSRPYWYLRKYVEGDDAGNITTDFGFSKSFLARVSAGEMLRLITSLWRLGTDRQELDFSPEVLLPHQRPNIMIIPADAIFSLEEIGPALATFVQGHSRALENERFALCHNDLYPGNIFLREKDAKLVIIDWERAAWNYKLYDLAFIWLLAWRNLDWQERFYREIILTLDEGTGDSWDLLRVHWGARLFKHASLMIPKYKREGRQEDAFTAQKLKNFLNKMFSDIIG